MRQCLRRCIEAARQSYRQGRDATGSRSAGLRNALFTTWADRVRRSRPLACDFNALTEADLCPHSAVWTIRRIPRHIVRCRQCGAAFSTRRDALPVAIERHDGDYFLANKDFLHSDGKPDVFSYVMPRTLFFWALDFPRFRPKNRRALDVGCGIGIMVRYLQFLGLEAEGIEISRWAVEYAHRELGLTNVRQGTIHEADYPAAAFSFVSLVHVVEHLDDPVPVLREVYRILEPGGAIYVELPSSERDTSDYGIDDHFWFYSTHALHRLLSCIGFRDVRIGEGTFDKRLHNVPFIFAAGFKSPGPTDE